MVIIRDLADCPCRFSDLQTLFRVNPGTLSERLSRLQAPGVVVHSAEIGSSCQMTLAPTEKGRALLPVLETMRNFW